MNEVPGIEGMVAVVSGGASGIGRAIRERWNGSGGIAVGLDLDGGDDLTMKCDVTDEDQVSGSVVAVVSEHGRLDAVFHCAGIMEPATALDELDLDTWRAALDVHATGGFLMAKHSLGPMAAGGGGAVTFIGSIVADGGSPLHAAYAAAKAALVNLSMSLAATGARQRIRSNVVTPGSVADTNLLKSSRGTGLTLAELAQLCQSIPLGRAATASDIAESACFLASPAARHVTGATLVVDGGEGLPRKLPASRAESPQGGDR